LPSTGRTGTDTKMETVPMTHGTSTTWLVWPKQCEVKRFVASSEPEQKPKREPAAWRPMTEQERIACCAIGPGVVTYPPATSVKRLARHLSEQAHDKEPKITDKQADALWKIAWRFRRQIANPDVLNIARQKAAKQ
jgi:hypothetical protein